MNVSLTPVNMCNLLMCGMLPTMEDNYNCTTDLMPIDPKKLVEQLTKIGTKPKEVTSEMLSEDRQNGKGHPGKSRSNKKRALSGASHKLKGAILKNAIPKKAEKQ